MNVYEALRIRIERWLLEDPLSGGVIDWDIAGMPAETSTRRYGSHGGRKRRSPSKDRRRSSRSRSGEEERRNARRNNSPSRHDRHPRASKSPIRQSDRRRDEKEGWRSRGRPTNSTSTWPQKRSIKREDGQEEQLQRHNPVPEYGKPDAPKEDPNKVKPNFGLSGKLLEDTNMLNGVVVAYSQPPEARKPKVRWRLYPFKGEETLPTMFIHRQSAYLLGRDRRVVDIPLDHPSISKQHAVIQYRMLPAQKEDGSVVSRVRPYIMDLGSGNGTFVNKKRIEATRYVQLLEKDVLTFGFSSREYVMLHEGSKDDEYKSGDESDGNKSD